MISVFGSINVDLVVRVEHLPQAGETVLGSGYEIVGGGKGANQALAAARAGSLVRMFGCVGRDGFAEPATFQLAEAGVDLTNVRTVDRPTGCALIAVASNGQNQIVVASGANLDVRAGQLQGAELGEGDILVMQMEVSHAENWAAIELAKRRGARVLLNCAPAGTVPLHVLRLLDWLVVNETEASQLSETLGVMTKDPIRAAQTIAASSKSWVIVTLGSAGAMAFVGDEIWSIGSLQVTPIDTTAAGDAFVGALAAAIDQGIHMPVALQRASIAGGLACMVMGAQPSLPTRAAIDAQLGNLAPAVRATLEEAELDAGS
jgi:ribokinase